MALLPSCDMPYPARPTSPAVQTCKVKTSATLEERKRSAALTMLARAASSWAGSWGTGPMGTSTRASVLNCTTPAWTPVGVEGGFSQSDELI